MSETTYSRTHRSMHFIESRKLVPMNKSIFTVINNVIQGFVYINDIININKTCYHYIR